MLDRLFAKPDNTRMDPFHGMEAFARVVESGSFTAAAASLQTAKSSVSDTIRALEDRLGVRLLDRTTRRVRPTEAGREFYAQCRRLLDEAARARMELRTRAATPHGKLRIAAPDGFGQRYLMPVLPAFIAAHPGMEIEFVEGAGIARLVDEGLDLAIRVARTPDPGWVVRRIATSEVVVVASPSYLAAQGTPSVPSELPRHRTIGYALLHWRDTWTLGTHRIALRPVLTTNGTESLRSAALSGLGIVALPRWLVADLLAGGQLRQILADHAAPPSGIFAVYPTNRLLAPAVRAFVDHIVRDLRARGLPP